MAAFPDAQFTLDELTQEGDRVGMRYHLDMTHQGDFQGIPATGKRVRLNGITIMHFENGRATDRWNEADFMGLLQQLSAIPAPEASGA